MYNRVSGQSIGFNRADESAQSVDSGRFAQALTECAQQESLSDGELPDQMGSCCSRPDANGYSPEPSDSSTSSLSYDSNPSSLSCDSNPSSPARPIRALFDYRTAELPEANVNGICVGLVVEWLLNLHSSPSSRMSALYPGTQNHVSAAARQRRYQRIKTSLRNDGAAGSHNLQARSATLREADLRPSNEETRYRFGSSSRIARIVDKVTADPSIYLIGLRFAAGGKHTIATSTSNAMTTLFDPNYGEFTVRSDQMDELFKSLAERYRKPPNRHEISTVVTQGVELRVRSL